MKAEITNPIAYLGDDFLKVGPNFYRHGVSKETRRVSQRPPLSSFG